MGGINAFKGVPLLLKAWKLLAPQNAELWLVGQASPRVLRLIPNLPGLTYLGKVPHKELSVLIAQCDVLVFPSYFEGFGMVILEAMASGLPVITTKATGGFDIITDGYDGWITDVGDLNRLVELMEACLIDRKRVSEMGFRARQTAERFTWAKHARGYLEIVASAIK